MGIDPKIMAQAMTNLTPQWVREWLPNGQDEGDYWVSTWGPDRELCRVNLLTGMWTNGTDEQRDLFSLYALLHDISETEAAHALAALVEKTLGIVPRETSAPRKVKRGRPRGEPNGKTLDLESSSSAHLAHQELGLQCNHNQVPFDNLSNVMLILQSHPAVAGRIWADDFLKRMMTDWNGPKREWRDGDDLLLTAWIQTHLGMPKVLLRTVQNAVEAIAFINRKNEVLEWLDSLQWDIVERLPTLLSDAFGAVQDEYTAAVGRCWFISMVKRAMRPGEKADYVPVFEGIEGIKKSTAMQIIGGEWFKEIHDQIMTKDFLQALQGAWLIEIAELNSFSKSEIRRIKGIISCQNDYYRASYGRRHEPHPRQCIFVATTNETDWNESDTGARRFWPVACTAINDGYLRANRNQLFAEAVARFRAGEPSWNVPVELARAEQEKRRPTDAWHERIRHWLIGKTDCNCEEVLTACIDMKPDQQDMRALKRVARTLRMLGWEMTQKKINGVNLKRWYPVYIHQEGATKNLFEATGATDDPY